MGLEDDLELVVSRTGHLAYRELVDPFHPSYAPAWVEQVHALAERFRGRPNPATRPPDRNVRTPAPPNPRVPSRDDLAKVRECPHRECRTGCQASRCKLGKGYRRPDDPWGDVTVYDCLGCLGVPGYAPPAGG